MTPHHIIYLVFGVVIILALMLDLGFINKRNRVETIKLAVVQTFGWVLLALLFGFFLFKEEGSASFLEYISAYLMEWSLSIDNIFVFVLIFNAFRVREVHTGRVLLIGVMAAIVLRVLFITLGMELVSHFKWILYLFGIFLVYTGYRMIKSDDDSEFDPQKNKVYLLLKRFLPLSSTDGDGRMIIRTKGGKPRYTILFVVVVILSTVDIAFALDSIPAVMGISSERLVIYTSNIFAVLGLRSLFFLLRGAVNRFRYLKYGISVVLIFIGLKMLLARFLEPILTQKELIVLSLLVILICLGVSILISLIANRKDASPGGHPHHKI